MKYKVLLLFLIFSRVYANAEIIRLGKISEIFPDAFCVAVLSPEEFKIIWRKGNNPDPEKPASSRAFQSALIIYSKSLSPEGGAVSNKSSLIIRDNKIEIPIKKNGSIVFVKVDLLAILNSIKSDEVISGEVDGTPNKPPH